MAVFIAAVGVIVSGMSCFVLGRRSMVGGRYGRAYRDGFRDGENRALARILIRTSDTGSVPRGGSTPGIVAKRHVPRCAASTLDDSRDADDTRPTAVPRATAGPRDANLYRSVVNTRPGSTRRPGP